jgi:hypothetical protein
MLVTEGWETEGCLHPACEGQARPLGTGEGGPAAVPGGDGFDGASSVLYVAGGGACCCNVGDRRVSACST